jgi:hypothetical protein
MIFSVCLLATWHVIVRDPTENGGSDCPNSTLPILLEYMHDMNIMRQNGRGDVNVSRQSVLTWAEDLNVVCRYVHMSICELYTCYIMKICKGKCMGLLHIGYMSVPKCIDCVYVWSCLCLLSNLARLRAVTPELVWTRWGFLHWANVRTFQSQKRVLHTAHLKCLKKLWKIWSKKVLLMVKINK